MGTAIVRPSSRSTDRVSSVTVALTTLGRMSVTTADCVPFISQGLQMLTHHALDFTKLSAAIAVVCCQRDVGIKPEFGAPVLAVDVHQKLALRFSRSTCICRGSRQS